MVTDILLTVNRGADEIILFRAPDVDLTGYTATLFLTPFGADTVPYPLLVELPDPPDLDGPSSDDVETIMWTQLTHTQTQLLPQGRLTSFELQLIQPDTRHKIIARGDIEAIGGLNDD